MKQTSIGRIYLLPLHIQRTYSLHLKPCCWLALKASGLKVTTQILPNKLFGNKMLERCIFIMGDLGLDQADPRGTFRGQRSACWEFGLLLDLTVKRNRKGNSTVFCPKEPFFFSCDQGAAHKKKGAGLAEVLGGSYQVKSFLTLEEKAGIAL